MKVAKHILIVLFSLGLLTCSNESLEAVTEHVVIQRHGQSHHLKGKVLASDRNGGLLLVTQDGRMWMVKATELLYRETLTSPLPPQQVTQIQKQLLDELPAGYRVHRTAHYLICYNTSPVFARWWGALAERLYRGFYGYWKYRGRELHPPTYPLVAIVFDSQSSYVDFCREELGSASDQFIGHYSQETNRVCTFDLTGTDRFAPASRSASSLNHITRMLAQPTAERTVATIIHETTHQLAFNSGLQIRFADNPAWVSEGIATFFESPNLEDQRGWDRVGEVNRFNLRQFRLAAAETSKLQLFPLLASDGGFKDPERVWASYAQSWALTYFLLRTRRQQFIDYLGKLALQPRLVEYSAEQRIELFRGSFSADLERLERDWLRYMARLK